MTTPYHPTRKYSVRPNRFRLAPDHPLNRKLAFAGLGANSGSIYFADSSLPIYQTEITGSDYFWSYGLGRPVLKQVTFTPSSGQYIDIPDITLNDGFSFSIWTKPLFDSNSRYALGSNFSPARYYLLKNVSNNLVLGLGSNSAAVTYLSMTDGAWHHVAATMQGSTCELFVDGAFAGTNTVSFSGTTTGTGIGAFNQSTGQWYGELADYMQWNRVLSQTEIQGLARTDPMLDGWIQPLPTITYSIPKEEPTPPTGQTVVYHPIRKYSVRPNRFRLAPDHPLSNGCVFAGLGNVAGSNTYIDSSATKGNSTLAGSWDVEMGRRCVFHDTGEVTDVAVFGAAGELGPITVSIWINPTLLQPWIMPYGTGTGYTGWRDPTLFRVSMNFGFKDFTTSGSPVVGTWNHWCTTFENEGLVHLYIDGMEEGTPVSTTNPNERYFLSELGDIGQGLAKSADYVVHRRILSEAERLLLIQPSDPMLNGWIQPLPTQTYTFGGEVTPPTEIVTDIFESAIIGV